MHFKAEKYGDEDGQNCPPDIGEKTDSDGFLNEKLAKSDDV